LFRRAIASAAALTTTSSPSLSTASPFRGFAEKLLENVEGAEKAKRVCGTATDLMEPAWVSLKENFP
jgi:hypothetical protein